MIIVLNNKCNFTKEEFIKYQNHLEDIEADNQIILCPSNVFLALFDSKEIELGSQNVGDKDMGAYTGEVSAKQLKSLNVEYCLVGHSERRKYQQETSKEINEKIKMLLENNIIPIYCVGEEKEERLNNTYKNKIVRDIKLSLKNLTEEEKNKLIIAYEPVWSVGTGLIPTNEEIEEIVNIIKESLPKNRVIYGGSVNEENISNLKNINSIDGYLLGGLSLSIENLKKFIKKM